MLGHLLPHAVLILTIISGIGVSACSGDDEHCSMQEQKRLLHTRGQLGSTRTNDGVQVKSWRTSTGDWIACEFVTDNETADCQTEAQTLTQGADARGDAPSYVVNNWAICKYVDGKLQKKNGQPPEPCLIDFDDAGMGYGCFACYHYTGDPDQKPPTVPPTPAPAPTPEIGRASCRERV